MCAPNFKACDSDCIPMATPCTTLYAMISVSAGSQLLRFGSTTPGTLDASLPVTGLPSGVRIIAMDFRPSTGVLYGIGGDNNLYTINTTTAAVTAGPAISVALETTPSQYVAAAFVPGADTIRIWNATGQNLRVNPTTGAATVDTRLPQGFGTGVAPRAIAFTDNPVTMYVLDALNDTLSTSPDPTAGTVVQIAPLGFDMEAAGFDIQAGTGAAYAATMLNSVTDRMFTLYRVNLTTGALTSVGPINSPPGLVKALAIAP
jgi:hypothetical protein